MHKDAGMEVRHSPASSDQLLLELRRRFPQFPDDVIRKHIIQNNRVKDLCVDSLQRASSQQAVSQQQHFNMEGLRHLTLDEAPKDDFALPYTNPPFSRSAPANRSLPHLPSVSAVSLAPFVGRDQLPPSIACATGSTNGMSRVRSVSVINPVHHTPPIPKRSFSEQVNSPGMNCPPEAVGYHFPDTAWGGAMARARSHDRMHDHNSPPSRQFVAKGPPELPSHRHSDSGYPAQRNYTTAAFIQMGTRHHSVVNPPVSAMMAAHGPSEPLSSSPQVPYLPQPFGWRHQPQRPENLFGSSESVLATGQRVSQESRMPLTPEQQPLSSPATSYYTSSPSDSSRTGSNDDYSQALIMYQSQRLHKLIQSLDVERRSLSSLRTQVRDMEKDVLQCRQRRNSAISAEDMQKMREENRQMQIEIQILAHEIDLINDGQIKLGVVETEDQNFYRNIPSGQQFSQPPFLRGDHSSSTAASGDGSAQSSPAPQRRRTPPPRPPPPNPPMLPLYTPTTPTHPPPPPYHQDLVVPPPIAPRPPPPTEATQWSCDRCTYLNDILMINCECCSMPRVMKDNVR